jgi:predicted metal-dependent enzyme (double-stranded beta helix superfamily)
VQPAPAPAPVAAAETGPPAEICDWPLCNPSAREGVMSEVDEYVQQLTDIVRTSGSDESQAARLVRTLTREALDRDSFLLACTERIVSSIERSSGEWRNPPLICTEEPPIIVRVFYWPPHSSNEPHLHDAWTVTGVLHNEITVETFRGANPADCTASDRSQRITARAGEAGFLLPPCVHRLHNASSSNSATLHIFSAEKPHDKAQVKTGAGRMTGLQQPRRRTNVKQRALCLLAQVLGRVRGNLATEVLQRIFAVGDAVARLQVVQLLVEYDIRLASEMSRKLEATLKGRDREALSRINAVLPAI